MAKYPLRLYCLYGNTGGMKLTDYLTKTGKSASDFAADLGLSVSTITRLLKGERQPKWATLEKIAAATAGKVRPNDFMGVP